MINMNKEYFKEIEDQINNEELFSKDYFMVYAHEAGLGKSVNCQRILGEMTKNKDYRAMYVQMFVKDGELDNTVDFINKCAGKSVAQRFAEEDIKSRLKRKKATSSQILCITHHMYKTICSGQNLDLIKERKILVIDEFPDIMDRVEISGNDIKNLWWDSWNNENLHDTALLFRNHLNQYITRCGTHNRKDMILANFGDDSFDYCRTIINSQIKCEKDKEKKKLLIKYKRVLENTSYFYEDRFLTYNKDVDFVMLDNNILLDANAGFNETYKLSSKLNVVEQEKKYRYEGSTMHHYLVSTSKSKLNKYVDFFKKALAEITIENGDRILFVTDKAHVQELRGAIEEKYKVFGDTIQEIEVKLGTELKIDYHGNLIGKNLYREFNKVAVLKTPFYNSQSYIMDYLFYSDSSIVMEENLSVFDNPTIAKIRNTITAGEIYQSIMRVNRSNLQSAHIYLFCDNQEIVDIVINQLPGINYFQFKFTMTVDKEKSYKTDNRNENSKLKMAKELILDYVSSGVEEVYKKEMRGKLGISENSRRNLTQLLNMLKPMMESYGITNKGQKLIFS